MNHPWIFWGAVSAFLSVAFGAFGAHGLADTLSEKSMKIFQTAVQYQFFHSLGLIGLGIWVALRPELNHQTLFNLTSWALAVGIVIFSGSLYGLSLSGVKILGAITPVGGVSFLIGWASLAVLAWRT